MTTTMITMMNYETRLNGNSTAIQHEKHLYVFTKKGAMSMFATFF